MRRIVTLACVLAGLAGACSKATTDNPAADKPATDKPATDKPAGDKPAPAKVDPAAKPVLDDSAHGLCERLCKKAIGCMGEPQGEIPACIAGCEVAAPLKAKVDELVTQDCS